MSWRARRLCSRLRRLPQGVCRCCHALNVSIAHGGWHWKLVGRECLNPHGGRKVRRVDRAGRRRRAMRGAARRAHMGHRLGGTSCFALDRRLIRSSAALGLASVGAGKLVELWPVSWGYAAFIALVLGQRPLALLPHNLLQSQLGRAGDGLVVDALPRVVIVEVVLP
eukprot:scaffold4930_cov26-Tisochrysis_lutea.AAC.2